MLGSAELIAFVATTELERARAFYEGVLGLALAADDPFALTFDANGVTLRVARVQAVAAVPYTVLGWKVADGQPPRALGPWRSQRALRRHAAGRLGRVDFAERGAGGVGQGPGREPVVTDAA